MKTMKKIRILYELADVYDVRTFVVHVNFICLKKSRVVQKVESSIISLKPKARPISLEIISWEGGDCCNCLLYTSPSPRDLSTSRMPSSA